MSPLVGIMLMFALMGMVITGAILLAAELVRLLGWALAGLVNLFDHPSSGRTVFEGATFSALGLLWLTASIAGLCQIGTWLLRLSDEGALLAAVVTPAMLALWWVITLRLKMFRAAVSRVRGIPEDPWTWAMRGGRAQ